ncbi:MAG TPA: hypothetical protein VK181_26990 [Rhizobium sp.]|nr:hypothetical protein [Rhizobium sp.]
MPPIPSLSQAFNDMVGKPFNRQAFEAQAAREGFEARVIRPGDPVSKDLRMNRLNARLDAQDTVTRISFG